MMTRPTVRLPTTRRQRIIIHTQAWIDQRDPLVLIAATILPLIALLIVGATLQRMQRAPTVQAMLPTVAPIMIIQTARAVAVPTAVPTAQPRMTTAYDSPNGAAFPDPIPVPDPSQWIGRWGDGWIEVVWQPNPVWIRTADLGAQLADVRPPTIQIAPTAAPAAAPADQQYTVANQSPPLPARMEDLSDAQLAQIRAQLGVTDADMARALDAHNAQQLAWCQGRPTAYCAMVRGAASP